MVLLVAFSMVGCSKAEVASTNVSKEADAFRVKRRIIFYNSIQDVYILQMVGNCSITVTESGKMLEVICKTGEKSYQKHFLGLSDNVTYTVEQLGFSEVSSYQYEIIFRPSVIIPIIEVD
jgi:hypothetical protein